MFGQRCPNCGSGRYVFPCKCPDCDYTLEVIKIKKG